jgi:hypothetical protein
MIPHRPCRAKTHEIRARVLKDCQRKPPLPVLRITIDYSHLVEEDSKNYILYLLANFIYQWYLYSIHESAYQERKNPEITGVFLHISCIGPNSCSAHTINRRGVWFK